MDPPGHVNARETTAFDFGGVVPGLVAGGFGFYALAQSFVFILFLKDAFWEGDGTLGNLAFLFSIVAFVLMSGVLILGGAFSERIPGWGRVARVGVGAFLVRSFGFGEAMNRV